MKVKQYFWGTITSIFRTVRVSQASKEAHNQQAACPDQVPPPHPFSWIWVTTLLTNCICNLTASSPHSHWASWLRWLCFWLVFGTRPIQIVTRIPPILTGGFCFSSRLSGDDTIREAATPSFHIFTNWCFTNCPPIQSYTVWVTYGYH